MAMSVSQTLKLCKQKTDLPSLLSMEGCFCLWYKEEPHACVNHEGCRLIIHTEVNPMLGSQD